MRHGDGTKRLGRILCGILYLEIGFLFLLDLTGLLRIPALWRIWPVFLLAIGACRTLERRYGAAAALSLTGAACLAVEAGWLGLSLPNAWPVLLIASGVGILVGARADGPAVEADRGPVDVTEAKVR